jgi:isoleucyl-tRNA synthetase
MAETRDEKLEDAMNAARKIFEAGSFVRQKAGIKLRHPVASVTVVGDEKVKKACELLGEVIAKQMNAKKVAYTTEVPGTTYAFTPNFKVLGPKYGKDAPKAAEAIRAGGAALKKAYAEGKAITLGGFKVSPDMISELKIVVPEKYAAGDFTHEGASGVVYIDTERDESLINEALARELIRNIQELRKKEMLQELDRIKVVVSESGRVKKMLSEFKEKVLTEVRADEIKFEKGVSGASFEFEGEEISVAITF